MGATPTLTVTCRVGSTAVAAETASQSRSASATAVAALPAGRITANSSPPSRPSRASGPISPATAVATRRMIRSPTTWPRRSLMSLKLSMSIMSSAPPRGSAAQSAMADPMRRRFATPGERVVLGEEGQLGPVVEVLGDVADRAQHPGGTARGVAEHLAAPLEDALDEPGPVEVAAGHDGEPRAALDRAVEGRDELSAVVVVQSRDQPVPVVRHVGEPFDRRHQRLGELDGVVVDVPDPRALPADPLHPVEPPLRGHRPRVAAVGVVAIRLVGDLVQRAAAVERGGGDLPPADAARRRRPPGRDPAGPDPHRRERAERGARPAPATPAGGHQVAGRVVQPGDRPVPDHDEPDARRADDLLRDHAVGSLPQWQARTVDDQRR